MTRARPRRVALALLCLVACAPGPGAGLVSQAGAKDQEQADSSLMAATTAPRADVRDASRAKDLPAPNPYTPRPEDRVTPAQPVEDPTGRALDRFFAALARSDDGEAGALTRVSHFGDSSIGTDGLPHAIRRRFQARFGDGGAGFVNLHSYSGNIRSRVVDRNGSGVWQTCFITYGCRRDGHYGLGGHIFQPTRGDRTRIETKRKGEFGLEVSRFDLYYAESPSGGRIAVRVDGGEPTVIDTRGPELVDRFHEIRVPQGPHRVELEGRGNGYARAYGVVLETDGPGVVWDTMSMIGAFTKRLLLYNPEHIAQQVAHRGPDLIVFNFGGNDLRRLVGGGVKAEGFKDEVREAYERVRLGAPEASCLVVSVIDHGRSGNKTVEAKHVDTITAAQRDVAFELGCAFFNTLEAMGGPRSIFEWRKARPALASPDLKHLNERGWDRMGEMIYESLLAGYVDYRQRPGGGAVQAAAP